MQEEGDHFDTDKLRFDLIPPEVEAGIASIFTYGARKYGDRNWQGGIKVLRLLGSVRRHLNKWQAGEDIDSESGLLHIDHAMTNLAMIRWMLQNRPDMDNRKDYSCTSTESTLREPTPLITS